MATFNTTTSTFRIGFPGQGQTGGSTFTGYEIAGTGYTNFSNSGTVPTIAGVTINVDAVSKVVTFRSTSSGVNTNALFVVNGEWDDSGWSYNWVEGCNGFLFFGPNAKWRSGSAVLGAGGFTLNSTGGTNGIDFRDRSFCVDQINGANVSYSVATVEWYGVKFTHNGTNNATRMDLTFVFPVGVSGTIRNLTMFYDNGSTSHTAVGGPNTITFDNIISWNALWAFHAPYRALTPTAPLANYITYYNGDSVNFTKMSPVGALVANDKITYFSPSKNTLPLQILGPSFTGEVNRSWSPTIFNGYRFLTNDGTASTLSNLYSNTGFQYYNLNSGKKYELALQSRLTYRFIDVNNNNVNDVKVSVLNGSSTDSTRTRYVPSYAVVSGTQDTMSVLLLQNLTASSVNTLTVEAADVYCYASTTNTAAYVSFSTSAVTDSLSPAGVGFDYIGQKVAYAKRWGYFDHVYSWTPTQDNATRSIQATFVRDPYVKTTNVADEATANISNISLTNNSTNYLTFNQNSFITGDYIDGNQVYMKTIAYENADDQRPKNDFSIVSDELIFNGATDISLYNPPTVWTPTTGLRAVNAIKTNGTFTRSNTAGFTNQVFCKITARNISLGTLTTNRTQLYLNTAAGSGSISFATNPSGAFTICDGGAIVAGSTSSNPFKTPGYTAANRTFTMQNCDIGGYYSFSPGISGLTGSQFTFSNVKLVSNVTLNRSTDVADAYRFAPLTVNLLNVNFNGFTLTSNDANIIIRNPWSVTLSGTETIAQSAVKVAKIYTDTAQDTNKISQTVVISGGSGTGLPLTFTAQVPLQRNKSFIAWIDGFEPATAYVSSASELSVTNAAVTISTDVLNFQQALQTADTTLISNCTVTCTGTGTGQKVTIGVPSTASYTQASIAAAKLMVRRIQELSVAADDYHYKLARGTFTNLVVYQTYGFQVKSTSGTFTMEKITANDNNVSFVMYIVNINNILYTSATSTNIQKYIVFLLASPGAVLLLTDYDRETIAQFSTDALEPTLTTMNNNIGVVNDNVKDTSLLVPANRDITII
jgi:hypothetical protein